MSRSRYDIKKVFRMAAVGVVASVALGAVGCFFLQRNLEAKRRTKTDKLAAEAARYFQENPNESHAYISTEKGIIHLGVALKGEDYIFVVVEEPGKRAVSRELPLRKQPLPQSQP